MNAAEIKARVLAHIAHYEPTWMSAPWEQGVCIGMLDDALGGCKEGTPRRYQVLAYLFSETLGLGYRRALSSKLLDERCWYALVQWVGSYKDDVDGWVCAPELPDEAAVLAAEAGKCVRAHDERLYGEFFAGNGKD